MLIEVVVTPVACPLLGFWGMTGVVTATDEVKAELAMKLVASTR